MNLLLYRTIVALLIAAGCTVTPADAQTPTTGGEVFASSGRACGYPRYRVDMEKIVDAARGYPNARIFLLTPAERTRMEGKIAEWNRTHRESLVGMAPCLTCSQEYEACIVYQRDGDVFASNQRDEMFGSNGGGNDAGPGSSSGGGTDSDGERRDTPRAQPVPAASCRDQVEGLIVEARTTPGFSSGQLGLGPGGGPPYVISVSTGSGARQGTEIRARAQIRNGPIPPDRIQLRFVQIMRDYGAAYTWASGAITDAGLQSQGRTPPLDRCTLPLLDMYGRTDVPPPPFYKSAGQEPPIQSGVDRLVELRDSPRVLQLLNSPDDGSQLTGINVHWALRAYVGCTVRDDPAFPVGYFETLKTMDWNARLTMTVVARPGAPARAESVGDMSWVRFQPAVDSSERPDPIVAPTFNQCAAGTLARP